MTPTTPPPPGVAAAGARTTAGPVAPASDGPAPVRERARVSAAVTWVALVATVAAPVALNAVNLYRLSVDRLGLTGPAAYALPVTLDGAALVALLVRLRALRDGDSAPGASVAVVAFAGLSAWLAAVEGHTVGGIVGAVALGALPIVAVVMLDLTVASVRRADARTAGLLPGRAPIYSGLRWVLAPASTAKAWRHGVLWEQSDRLACLLATTPDVPVNLGHVDVRQLDVRQRDVRQRDDVRDDIHNRDVHHGHPIRHAGSPLLSRAPRELGQASAPAPAPAPRLDLPRRLPGAALAAPATRAHDRNEGTAATTEEPADTRGSTGAPPAAPTPEGRHADEDGPPARGHAHAGDAPGTTPPDVPPAPTAHPLSWSGAKRDLVRLLLTAGHHDRRELVAECARRGVHVSEREVTRLLGEHRRTTRPGPRRAPATPRAHRTG